MNGSTCQVRRGAIATWLLRGGYGGALLAIAMSTRDTMIVIPSLALAVVAFRGCPMCWVFGLMERVSQDPTPAARKRLS
jgi:hypothetical protein